ncbi:MAG: nucleotidyl transferase AbiEii/AbiGii toxin family protein [Elusimicrobiota bacterium]
MSKKIKNITASVRARLLNRSRETDISFQEILQYYGMERFLYRFCESIYGEKFILKGALMFTVWDIPHRRITRDIDFSANYDNKVSSIEELVREVCNMKVEDDGIKFDADTVKGEKIKEDAIYEGVRIKFTGFLGRARIPMQVDFGFNDRIYPKPKYSTYPVILNMPPPTIKGYPAESIISEKFEAMIKLGSLNSRMKDYYDIWLMMCYCSFEGEKLAKALKNTFKQRKTDLPRTPPFFNEDIYDLNSDRQLLWEAFINRNDMENIPGNLKTIAIQIEKFLKNPVEAIVKSENFNKKWPAPGPWK